MIGENPYWYRGPIKDTEHFYGRVRETALALQMARNGQSISVIGPRRIGKTSLLFHLSDATARAVYGSAQEESLFVYIDGQMLDGLSSSDILRAMLEETISQAGDNKVEMPHVADFRSFERTIREWSKPGHQLVFLIDEFEYLGESQDLADDFFSFLRGLTVRHNVVYITASQVPLLSLMSGGGQSNPFFNIFTPVHLGLFSKDDALQMIREPSRAAGLDFSNSAKDVILDLAGLHPFFLQITCFHAFELSRGATHFGEQSRAQLEEQVQADLKCHFEYFASRLSQEEQRVLVRLLEAEPSEHSTKALEALEQKCLICRYDERYTFVSRAFEHFVKYQMGTTWAAAVAEGDRRMATVLFADVAGFTPLAERRVLEEILDITKRALRIFVDVVDCHGGKVANFGGDSIMALFGVPLERSDDAIRATRAALEIQANIAKFASGLEQSKGIKFSVHVGLDTGVVVVGEIGGGQRSEYTALGDAVNLAHRMEELARPGDIVISDHTFQQVHGRFKTEALGPVQVKGKSRPVKAYRVLEERNDKR